jgi:hypothetical protein
MHVLVDKLINLLVFITELENVSGAVRTDLYIKQITFRPSRCSESKK